MYLLLSNIAYCKAVKSSNGTLSSMLVIAISSFALTSSLNAARPSSNVDLCYLTSFLFFLHLNSKFSRTKLV